MAWARFEECLGWGCRADESSDALPKGGYKDKCYGCGANRNGMLRCQVCGGGPVEVVDPNQELGVKNQEWLLNMNHCAPPIQVDCIGGTLTCKSAIKSDNNQPRQGSCEACLPDGNYMDSCSGCWVLQKTLTCESCKMGDGESVKASHLNLGRCSLPLRVSNSNGDLFCEGGWALPPGDYLDECQGCRLLPNSRTLHCDACADETGRSTRNVRYRTDRCEGGELTVIEGDLICTNLPPDKILPDGGYLDSCSNCRLESSRTVLKCFGCMNDVGESVEASVSMERCGPPKVINNHFGNLDCI